MIDKAYLHIDELPIYNWNKMHSTGELKYLLKEITKKIPGKLMVMLPFVWMNLYDQYILEFGFGEQFIEVLEKERRIALMEIQMVESGNEAMETMIDIERFHLDKTKETMGSTGANFIKLKAYLDKEMGFTIDTRKCTVLEFYSYLKDKHNG